MFRLLFFLVVALSLSFLMMMTLPGHNNDHSSSSRLFVLANSTNDTTSTTINTTAATTMNTTAATTMNTTAATTTNTTAATTNNTTEATTMNTTEATTTNTTEATTMNTTEATTNTTTVSTSVGSSQQQTTTTTVVDSTSTTTSPNNSSVGPSTTDANLDANTTTTSVDPSTTVNGNGSSASASTTAATTSANDNNNNNDPAAVSTTVAPGLPPSSPFNGFFAIFRPNINITKRSSASTSTPQQQAQSVTTRLVNLLTTIPDMSPMFDGAEYRARFVAALRLDLSIKLNLPAADIGVDSIAMFTGDPPHRDLGVTFRVAQVRGAEIKSQLNQIISNQLSSSSSSSTSSWTPSMDSLLTEAANLAINITASLQAEGIVEAEAEETMLTRASPDNSISTEAPPPGKVRNAACFVSDGDCAGTGIVISGLVLFLLVLVISVKIYLGYRDAWVAQERMDAKFAKEVEERSALRKKALEGKQEMEKEDLTNTLRQREEAHRQKQAQEALEMEEIKHQQIQAQQYHQQQAIIHQQQLLQQHQQQQSPHAHLNTQQRYDQHHLQQGLLGDSHHGRARDYELSNGTNDRLAQTAPTVNRNNNVNTFEYDDLL